MRSLALRTPGTGAERTWSFCRVSTGSTAVAGWAAAGAVGAAAGPPLGGLVVLLDTFVVCAVLGTALNLDVGRWSWWPAAEPANPSTRRTSSTTGEGRVSPPLPK